MPLANVVATRTGTGWTIDVTGAQLSSNTAEKDFTVLHNGIATPTTNYTKTTQFVLTYTGVAVASNTTIEVRRKTSFDNSSNYVTYANRFSSSTWNNALSRIQRWEEEVDLNGAGVVGAGVVPLPQNDAYGSVWTNDITYSPTRKVLWDKIETLAPIASPTLTGVPLAPSNGSILNTNRILTHADAYSALSFKADLTSPAFAGSPTAPTAVNSDNSTKLATTAHVKGVLANSPTITNAIVTGGTFSAPTMSGFASSTNYGGITAGSAAVATHSDVRTYSEARFLVHTSRIFPLTGYAAGTIYSVPFSQAIARNINSHYDSTYYRVYPQVTGWYYITGSVSVGTTGGTAPTEMRILIGGRVNDTTLTDRIIDQNTSNAGGLWLASYVTIVYLTAGTYWNLTFQAFFTGGSGFGLITPSTGANVLCVQYLGA